MEKGTQKSVYSAWTRILKNVIVISWKCLLDRFTCAVTKGVEIISFKAFESQFIENSWAISCIKCSFCSIEGGSVANFWANWQKQRKVVYISRRARWSTGFTFRIHTSRFTDDADIFPYRSVNMLLSSRNSGKSANLAAAYVRLDTASLHSLGHSLSRINKKGHFLYHVSLWPTWIERKTTMCNFLHVISL